MSGWSGGVANRTWRRDARGPDSGRLGLIEDVGKILETFRAAHGWEPGMVWDPRAASGCPRNCRERGRDAAPHGGYVWLADVTPSPWEAL